MIFLPATLGDSVYVILQALVRPFLLSFGRAGQKCYKHYHLNIKIKTWSNIRRADMAPGWVI